MSQFIDKIIFSGIIFVLIFTQLAFGGVHVWAYSVFETIIISLFLLFLFNQIVGKYRISKKSGKNARFVLQWVVSPLNIFIIVIIALIIIQLIPLPSFIVKFISPLTFEVKKNAYEIKHISSNDSIAWMNLSHYHSVTYNELFKLLSYVALYVMVIHSVKDQKRINRLVYVLVGMGLFQVIYGIVQTYSGSQKIWWWTNIYGKGWVTGTYINRNHLAGFLEMMIPLCFGFVVAHVKKTRNWQRFHSISKLKRFKNWFFSGKEKPKILLFFFMGMVLGLGLLLSGSRGGILSFGISMFFMIFLFAFKDGYRKYGIVAACLCMLIIAYGLHIGIDKTVERFEHFGGLYDRFEINESIVPMIKDFPVFGTGWGTFKYMYSRYALPEYSDHLILGNAHNDWLEMVSESGIIGAVVFLGALVIYLVSSIKLWLRRKDSFAIGLGGGVIFAVISISIHSFFDFNMHIPANPMSLSVIMAIGFLSLHMDRHANDDRFFFKTKSVSLKNRFSIILSIIVVLWIGWVMFNKITGHFIAEAYCSTELNSTLNRDQNPSLDNIKKAINYDPSNAGYYDGLAHYYMRLPFETEDTPIKMNEKTITNLEKAITLNPVNGIYWYNLGVSYSYKGYEGKTYYREWLPRVDKAFQMATYLRPNDSSMLYKIGLYWIYRSSMLLTEEDSLRKKSEKVRQWSIVQDLHKREDVIKKFQALLKRSLKLNTKYWEKAIERIWEYYPDEKIVMGIIPPEKGEELGLKVKKWIELKKDPSQNGLRLSKEK